MIGSVILLGRKMSKSFVKKLDEDWLVFDYKGFYDPYVGYEGKVHCAELVAVLKSRGDARTVARARRGNKNAA